MIGNLKVLGIALGAIFALSAVAAPSASALDIFTTSVEPAVVTASGTDNIFKITNAAPVEFHCWNATFAGTVKTKVAKEITLLPTYRGTETEPKSEECNSNFGKVKKFDMNGCDYILTGETTAEDPKGGGKRDATVWITCQVSKEIQITTNSGCTVSIAGQTPKEGGVVYKNGEEEVPAGSGKMVKDVKIEVTMTGLTYRTEGVVCGLAELPKEGSNADYIGTVTATCWEDLGSGVNFDEFKVGNACNLEVSES